MIIIGVDESGTGAVAGPFTVCALAVNDSTSWMLSSAGVTDSKKLRDEKRRALLTYIIDTAIVGVCVVVPVETINRGHRAAWCDAMLAAIRDVAKLVGPPYDVIVDGLADPWLVAALKLHGITAKFMPRADAKVSAVGGASIIAKTIRNDAMLVIDKEYPEYRWSSNFGYETRQHYDAIQKYGRSVHHRNTKKLIDMPVRPSPGQ